MKLHSLTGDRQVVDLLEERFKLGTNSMLTIKAPRQYCFVTAFVNFECCCQVQNHVASHNKYK